jgi:hypothetical protein
MLSDHEKYLGYEINEDGNIEYNEDNDETLNNYH